jgi:Na+:H+ antiporter, NhaA family
MSELTSAPVAPVGPGDHVRGPEGAPLVVVYGDYECPFCAALELRLRAVPIRVAFRHFPVRGSHPRAFAAACAAEAAGRQGAFWPMHDALYGARGLLGLAAVLAAARGLELDVERLGAELAEGTHASRVAQDLASGRAAGVTGTPAFFVNGARHDGGYDAQSLIAALERAR